MGPLSLLSLSEMIRSLSLGTSQASRPTPALSTQELTRGYRIKTVDGTSGLTDSFSLLKGELEHLQKKIDVHIDPITLANETGEELRILARSVLTLALAQGKSCKVTVSEAETAVCDASVYADGVVHLMQSVQEDLYRCSHMVYNAAQVLEDQALREAALVSQVDQLVVLWYR